MVPNEKACCLNYEITHNKLIHAIKEIKCEGGTMSVREVSKRVGVSVSTAYKHQCQELIRQALKEM